MRRTFVKICGLRTTSDMEALQGVDLDAAGFILVPGRRRFVPPEQLKVLLRMLPPGAMAVGVMMNPTRDEVMDWFFRADLDAVQLHGEESPEFCRWVKKTLSVQVIKAFTPDEAAEKGTVEAYAPWVDSVLLDSASGGQKGGTGIRFSWERIVEIRNKWHAAKRPVWVAGGLNPENVGELVARFAPDGVDVSSGVETDGCKDREKVRSFVEWVRIHDQKPVCNPN
ncbi:MAG: phosphoribosylanthranilate isomerase [Planifilum fulgidum]